MDSKSDSKLDSTSDSKPLNISNGGWQKFESDTEILTRKAVLWAEKVAIVDKNVSMDVSSPIVNGKPKKLAPNQKPVSCEDFLLGAENCEKPKPKVFTKNFT